MKKVILVAVAMISLVACSQTKEKKTDLQRENLKGKVKSWQEISYVKTYGQIEEEVYYGPLLVYNEQGYCIEENGYKSDGSLGAKWTFKYDEKGNLIEESRYNSDGSLGAKWTFKYDDKGNQIEKNLLYPDGSLGMKTTFKYDDEGNEIEKNLYNFDGSIALTETYTYKYDKEGNWIEKIEYGYGIIAKREIEYYK